MLLLEEGYAFTDECLSGEIHRWKYKADSV